MVPLRSGAGAGYGAIDSAIGARAFCAAILRRTPRSLQSMMPKTPPTAQRDRHGGTSATVNGVTVTLTQPPPTRPARSSLMSLSLHGDHGQLYARVTDSGGLISSLCLSLQR
jgi:hypothetical protein